MITTYSRLFILLFSFALAASASSLRFIHPNDPSVKFSHGWTISPSDASTTQPGASFNVVLPRQSSYFPIQPSLNLPFIFPKVGATRVVLLGSSSFHGGKLAVCLDCRRHAIHHSKIFNYTSARTSLLSTLTPNLIPL